MSDVQQGPGWWQASDGRWYPPEQHPNPPAKKNGGNLVAALMILGLIVVLVGWCSSLPDDATDDPPAGDEPAESPSSFEGQIVDVQVVNPATVNVTATITNTGDTPGVPECTIEVSDASGTYDGWDIYTAREPVQPGTTDQMVARLTVTNEGAAWVTESNIDCS